MSKYKIGDIEIYNDEKEESQSVEASLNVDIPSNGWGYIGIVTIEGYGYSEEAAIENMKDQIRNLITKLNSYL